MTFPSGTQGGHPDQSPPRPNPLAAVDLRTWLCLGTLLLALVAYFIGFSDSGAALSTEIDLLLAGGVLAALCTFRKSAEFFLPVAVVLSIVSAFSLLAKIVHIPADEEVTTATVLIFVFGILQMLVVIGAYLLDKQIIKVPAPGTGYGQPARWAGAGQEGQAGQAQSVQQTRFMPPSPQPQHDSYDQQRAGQPPAQASNPYGHPPVGTPPGDQPTSYMPRRAKPTSGRFEDEPRS